MENSFRNESINKQLFRRPHESWSATCDKNLLHNFMGAFPEIASEKEIDGEVIYCRIDTNKLINTHQAPCANRSRPPTALHN